MSDKHTPTPWRYQEESDAYTHIIRGPEEQYVCGFSQDSSGNSEADARLTVQAVNALPLLRECEEALRSALHSIPTNSDTCCICQCDLTKHSSGCVVLTIEFVLSRLREAREGKSQ